MIKITEKLAELIGAIIGDGCIRYKPKIGQYYVEIVGNIRDEKHYFDYLKKIILNELGLDAKVCERERGLRMKIYSKVFVEFLTNVMNIPFNNTKCQNVVIPKQIQARLNLLTNCIRGIVDTDGSLFLTHKSHRANYPIIEISSTSKNLAYQLREILGSKFRIGFRSFDRKNFHRLYVLSINGETQVDNWYKTIGFSNDRNIMRYKKLKYGDAGI
ncbi:MAG: hypothetical protein KJ601_04930 [Nanoarchaeota archaeon]|nr:hypothetical protein [Nanoarchaeota archaeon]